jgi:hypothetical protein
MVGSVPGSDFPIGQEIEWLSASRRKESVMSSVSGAQWQVKCMNSYVNTGIYLFDFPLRFNVVFTLTFSRMEWAWAQVGINFQGRSQLET